MSEKPVTCSDKEYTAVVLAGGEGTRLAPLSLGKPKALIPVANQAMISYPLKWLAKGGFTKPIIVTTQRISEEIEQWAAKACPEIGCTPTFHVIPDETDSAGRTAQALKAVAGKIERNALIVSCDTITDISISSVLSYHREKQSTATVVVKHAKPLDPKSKERHHVEYMGIEGDNRISFFASSAELSETARLPRGYLARRPSVTLTRSLFDSHIYVLSKWAVDLVAEKKNILSLKHELLPLLAEEQFRRMRSDGTWGSLGTVPPEHEPLPPVEAGFLPTMLCAEDVGCGRAVPHVYDPLRMYAYIADNDGKLAVDPTELKKLHMKATVDEEYLTRVHQISTLAEASRQLAVSTSHSGSVLGENVTIGQGSKLSRCVIFDNVTIGPGCVMKNTIVGGDTVIPEKVVLKECVVGYGIRQLTAGESYTGEAITPEDY